MKQFQKKCSICGRENMLTDHHKFSQTSINKRLYGKLIHSSINKQKLCIDCHLSKRKGIIVWNEKQFCEALKIKPRSKTGLL